MKELVEVIAKSLVDNPDEVTVTEKTEGKTVKIYKWVEPAIGSRQYIMLRAIAAFARKFAHQPEKYVIFIG